MKTIETLQSVKTPDAGSTCTILVSKNVLELPFFDKSVAETMAELPYGVALHYRTGEVIAVPYSNIRYIITSAEINEKKETPHSFDPFKKNKNK